MAFRDEARMLAKWISNDGSLAPKSQLTHGIYFMEKTNYYYHYHKGQTTHLTYEGALREIFGAMCNYDFIDIDLEILELVRLRYRDQALISSSKNEKLRENLDNFSDY